MKRRNVLVKQLSIIIVLFLALTSNGFAGKIGCECPAIDAANNIFDASVLVKESRISIEKGDERYPVVISLYRPTSKGCERSEFAKYSIEGSAPIVDSLFFMRIQGRVNVFAIVSWVINNRGDGTYGKLYQVYAYQIESNGKIYENKRVAENGLMTGIEGYAGGRESTFIYKTAAEVKRFWRGR